MPPPSAHAARMVIPSHLLVLPKSPTVLPVKLPCPKIKARPTSNINVRVLARTWACALEGGAIMPAYFIQFFYSVFFK